MKDNKISEIVVPIKVNSQAMVCSNKVYFSNESNFPADQKFVTFKGFILNYGLSPEIPKGKMGVSSKFREFLTLNLIQEVFVQLYRRREQDQPAASILFKI